MKFEKSEWKRQRVKDVVNFIDQGWSPNAENKKVENQEWGVLKLSSINDGKYIESEHKTLSKTTEPKRIYTVEEGTVLMVRSNTPKLVGEVCYVHKTNHNMMYSDLIYKLDVNRNKIDAQFLTYILRSETNKTQIAMSAKGLNDSMVKVSQQAINNWSITIPSLKNQMKIVEYLNKAITKLDKKILLIRDKVIKYQELKQATVNQALLKGRNQQTTYKETKIEWIGKIPKHWKLKRFKDIQNKISSGLKKFTNERHYLSTKSIAQNMILSNEGVVTFSNRPSRANMQPKKKLCLVCKDEIY